MFTGGMSLLLPYRLLPAFTPCGLICLAVVSAAAGSAGAPLFVYIGTYTGPKSKGIYVSRFDPANGKLAAPELAAETKNPSFLAVHPSGRFLYAVGELENFGGRRGGAVNAFSIERSSGKLTLLNQQPSGGAGPCHVAVDAKGQCALVANYGSGSIAALPIGRDGKLAAPSMTIQHAGSSVNAQRQAGPHAHFITTDPADRFALVCDLGLDQVLVYGLDGAKGSLVANDPPFGRVKAGSGPRHLAFHPTGRWVYVINEMGSSLSAFAWDGKRGALTELQTVSTLPEGYGGQSSCAEVAVHPTGKFVYGSNRGHDSIVVFAVDGRSGKLSYVEHAPTGGKTPRHFAIDPKGEWLLAENQDSGSVVVFRVDGKTGRLSATGEKIEVGSPVCAVWVKGED